MSTPLRTILAGLALAFAAASCAGGGSSSTSVPANLQSAQQSPSTAARSTAERHDNNDEGGEHGKPSPSPAPYTLYGDATLVHPGDNSPTAVQLIWSPTQPYGGIDYAVPAGLTVSQLNNLSTDFKFTQGTCSQGSPRFQINVLGGNVFAYLGPQFPSVTNPCAGATYSNSTNVISPVSLVDATQVGGGYETWSAFQAQHGTAAVTGIQLVVDGFTTSYITAQFDNTQINTKLYTYESAASCKNGGYKLFTSSPGPFKNEGACTRYFNGGKDDGDNSDHKGDDKGD